MPLTEHISKLMVKTTALHLLATLFSLGLPFINLKGYQDAKNDYYNVSKTPPQGTKLVSKMKHEFSLKAAECSVGTAKTGLTIYSI